MPVTIDSHHGAVAGGACRWCAAGCASRGRAPAVVLAWRGGDVGPDQGEHEGGLAARWAGTLLFEVNRMGYVPRVRWHGMVVAFDPIKAARLGMLDVQRV